MQTIKDSKLVGKKGIAIHNGMKIRVEVIHEMFSHRKSKLYCKSDGVSGKFLVDAQNVVFLEDFE